MIRDLKDSRVESIIQRHRSYWNNEELPDGRPLFQINPVNSLVSTPDPHELEPPPLLDGGTFRDQTERSYDQNGLLTDDLIRMVGTGITTEVLVGCRVVVRAGTHWAEPAFTDWNQLDDYKVQETIWYRRLMENTRRAVDAVDTDRYPFSCMAVRGTVDMAEAFMTGEHLCAAIVDNPRKLKDLLARITDIIIETTLAHSALIPRFCGGQFNPYGIWVPGSTVIFSLDGGCLFSPACYEEFFLPCDQRLCQAFETPFVHLHAASRQHFPAWTEIPNLGLQCVIDQAWLPEGSNQPIGPQLEDLLPAFKEIRKRKSLMVYGYWNEALLDRAISELPVGGSVINGMVEQPEAIRQKYITPKITE